MNFGLRRASSRSIRCRTMSCRSTAPKPALLPWMAVGGGSDLQERHFYERGHNGHWVSTAVHICGVGRRRCLATGAESDLYERGSRAAVRHYQPRPRRWPKSRRTAGYTKTCNDVIPQAGADRQRPWVFASHAIHAIHAPRWPL